MNKKLGMFAIGYLLAIIIMFVIPVIIVYPNVVSNIENNYEQINYLSEINEQVNPDESFAIVSFLKGEVNVRNYIIAFYALSLFLVLILIGLLCIKCEMKPLGKGVLIGDFVGAAGFVATVVFSASYFIL